MPDDTRCGLDASSLHLDTSMDISLAKKFRLLSCHRDTSSTVRKKAKEKLRNCLPSYKLNFVVIVKIIFLVLKNSHKIF